MDNMLSLLRNRANISDSALAQRSGVSRSTIHRIDNGAASPTMRTLRELAIAAGLDINGQTFRFVTGSTMRSQVQQQSQQRRHLIGVALLRYCGVNL